MECRIHTQISLPSAVPLPRSKSAGIYYVVGDADDDTRSSTRRLPDRTCLTYWRCKIPIISHHRAMEAIGNLGMHPGGN
jgi:hypothetical protein